MECSQLFYENWRKIDYFFTSERSYFSEFTRFSIHLERLLRNGADINEMLFGYQSEQSYFYCTPEYEYSPPKKIRVLRHYDILSSWCEKPRDYPFFESRSIRRYTRLLLRNGLSYFYGDVMMDYRNEYYGYGFAPDMAPDQHHNLPQLQLGQIGVLITCDWFTKQKRCIRIAYQLLALGFGRREVHPGDLPVRDEHLVLTRDTITQDLQHV